MDGGKVGTVATNAKKENHVQCLRIFSSNWHRVGETLPAKLNRTEHTTLGGSPNSPRRVAR